MRMPDTDLCHKAYLEEIASFEMFMRAARVASDPKQTRHALCMAAHRAIAASACTVGLPPENDRAPFLAAIGNSALFRANIERYDFAKHHEEQRGLDFSLLGYDSAGLMFHFGEVGEARIGWKKLIDAFKQLSTRSKSRAEHAVVAVSVQYSIPGPMLAAGEVELLRELVQVLPLCAAHGNLSELEEWEKALHDLACQHSGGDAAMQACGGDAEKLGRTGD